MSRIAIYFFTFCIGVIILFVVFVGVNWDEINKTQIEPIATSIKIIDIPGLTDYSKEIITSQEYVDVPEEIPITPDQSSKIKVKPIEEKLFSQKYYKINPQKQIEDFNQLLSEIKFVSDSRGNLVKTYATGVTRGYFNVLTGFVVGTGELLIGTPKMAWKTVRHPVDTVKNIYNTDFRALPSEVVNGYFDDLERKIAKRSNININNILLEETVSTIKLKRKIEFGTEAALLVASIAQVESQGFKVATRSQAARVGARIASKAEARIAGQALKTDIKIATQAERTAARMAGQVEKTEAVMAGQALKTDVKIAGQVEKTEAVMAGQALKTDVKIATQAERTGARMAGQGSMVVKYTDNTSGFDYYIDHLDRAIKVEGKLSLKKSGERAPIKPSLEELGGKTNDHRGHIIADQFNGSPDKYNLIAQSSKTNMSGGAWYNMEQEWASALKQGKKVDLSIRPQYRGTKTRPYQINVTYSIDGNITQVVIPNP